MVVSMRSANSVARKPQILAQRAKADPKDQKRTQPGIQQKLLQVQMLRDESGTRSAVEDAVDGIAIGILCLLLLKIASWLTL